MKKLNGGKLMSKVILRKNKRDLGNYNIKLVIIKIYRRLDNLYIIIKIYKDHKCLVQKIGCWQSMTKKFSIFIKK